MQDGWTPLHVAVQSRNRDIAKILLVNGADQTRRTNVWPFVLMFMVICSLFSQTLPFVPCHSIVIPLPQNFHSYLHLDACLAMNSELKLMSKLHGLMLYVIQMSQH
jgi:ankyrin repeat protein